MLWLLIPAIGSVGWLLPSTAQQQPELLIVTTTGILADTVRNIVGEDRPAGSRPIRVVAIIGANGNPHSYKSTLRDAQLIEQATIIFTNGLHLEGPLADDLTQFGHTTHKVYAVSDALPSTSILHKEGGADPHIWLSIPHWMQVTTYISQKIQEIDPAHTATYKRETARFLRQMRALDRYQRAQVQTIPPHRRIICMPHNALSYMAKEYGLQVNSLQGISTVSEPSLQTRFAIGEMLIAQGIPAIFLETSTDNKGMQAIQEDCQNKGHHVKSYTLYTDALEQEGAASTYLGMIKHNIDTIAEALST